MKTEQTLSEIYGYPLTSWEIGNGDFIDLACESCALIYAKENNLKQVTTKYFQDQENENGHASECYGCGHETDTPASCNCGEYLNCNLTPEGIEYLKERDFPKWLVKHYLGDK